MENRKTTRDIEIQGRTFQINKMDAMTAMYTAMSVATKGLGIMAPLMRNMAPSIANKIAPGLQLMSKGEFFMLQQDLLSVCSEVLPSGAVPVFNETGKIALVDFETNAQLVLLLTVNSLIWNLADFFDENLLKELKNSLAGISLFEQKTST